MSCAVAVNGSPAFSPSRETDYSHAVLSSPESSAAAVESQSWVRRLRRQAGGGVGRVGVGPVVLKRKRPAKLEIPLWSPCSAEAREAAARALGPREVEIETEWFSVFCKKGRREAMEDRHSAVVDLDGDPKTALFGVFDGHGGVKAAEFAAENIDKHVMREVRNVGQGEIKEAIKRGYLATDKDFVKKGFNGGTCCVTALIMNGNLVVSNAGDCRAVMSRGGVAEALTVDHRPSREDERDRVQKLGGYVDNSHGVWRIQGSLAVSRGIGDSHLKQWVIAEPETRISRIDMDCEFLILASDGLWDKVSNQEAVNMARPLCIGTNKRGMLSACKKLSDLSLARGSADDISVMIIQLGRFL